MCKNLKSNGSSGKIVRFWWKLMRFWKDTQSSIHSLTLYQCLAKYRRGSLFCQWYILLTYVFIVCPCPSFPISVTLEVSIFCVNQKHIQTCYCIISLFESKEKNTAWQISFTGLIYIYLQCTLFWKTSIFCLCIIPGLPVTSFHIFWEVFTHSKYDRNDTLQELSI